MTLKRKHMRLDDYDYSLPGAYFLTVCASKPVPLFGRVAGNTVKLNSLGRLVLQTLCEIPPHYPHVQLDAHVVMPDHLHAILLLNLDNPDGIVRERTPALPQLMKRFKSLASRRYGELRKANRMWTLPEKLWQRGYYDRILRGENDLDEKRAYILSNPQRWTLKHGSE